MPDDQNWLMRHCGVNIARNCIQERLGHSVRPRGEYVAAVRTRGPVRHDRTLNRVVGELEARADAGQLATPGALLAFVDEHAPDAVIGSAPDALLKGLAAGAQRYGALSSGS